MSFLSILDSLFLEPFKTLFEIIFFICNKVSGSLSASLVLLGLFSALLLLPIFRSIHALRVNFKEKKDKFVSEFKEIRAAGEGEERKAALKNHFKSNKAFPIYFLSDFLYLVFLVPIFVSLYLFISNLAIIQNASFGLIKNLATPDALIKLGSLKVNILPIAVFVLSVAAVVLHTWKGKWQTMVHLLLFPVVAFFFLWNAPSALVFMFLICAAMCMLFTANHKFAKTKLYINISLAAVGLALTIVGIFHKAVLFIGIVLMLPIVLYLIKNIALKKLMSIKRVGDFFAKFKVEKPSKLQFLINAVLLVIFVGLFIPATYIAASPLEYINVNLFFNPLNYVLSSVLISAGTFLIWTTLFYFMSGAKTRIILERVLFVYGIVMLVDYMFFGLKLGIISATLSYENGLTFSVLELAINIVVVLAICLFFTFAYKKIKSYISFLLILVVVVFSGMSTFNMISAAKPINEYKKYNLNKSDVNFSLTKTGHNVIVIMLDRALGQYLPYIFNELPELKEKFDGFTHYINTISFGNSTNTAVPAMLGGYEYTPVEINKRDDELLKDKNNEANLVMPRIFADQGYKVTVSDPVYMNYKWISDLSVFDEYENINAFNSIGMFVDKKQTDHIYQLTLSNFFRFSFMKTLPLCVQSVLYDGGNYNNFEPVQKVEKGDKEESGETIKYGNQVTDGISKATGIYSSFMNNYLTLTNLEKMTMINSDESNTFLFFRNDVTHEPMMLDEANGYVPSANVDNTEYDAAHSDRFELDGKKINIITEQKMIHYQTNVAALKQVGKWLDYLRETGTYDNSRIIIASDHGRSLWSIPYLQFKDNQFESYAPLLMVKDFNDTGFETSMEFMTNADIPTIATQGLGFVAKNPFSNKEINMNEKYAHKQYITKSIEWDVSINNGKTFLPSDWLVFDSTAPNCNIYNPDNWGLINDIVTLKNHSY